MLAFGAGDSGSNPLGAIRQHFCRFWPRRPLRAWSRRSRTTQPRVRRPPPLDLSPTPSELTLSEGRSSTGLPILSLRGSPLSRSSLELPDCAKQIMRPPKLSRWQHLGGHPRDGTVVRLEPLPNAIATIRFRPSSEPSRWLGCHPLPPQGNPGPVSTSLNPPARPIRWGAKCPPSPKLWSRGIRGHPGQPGGCRRLGRKYPTNSQIHRSNAHFRFGRPRAARARASAEGPPNFSLRCEPRDQRRVTNPSPARAASS
jgi:hypothetical protein